MISLGECDLVPRVAQLLSRFSASATQMSVGSHSRNSVWRDRHREEVTSCSQYLSVMYFLMTA